MLLRLAWRNIWRNGRRSAIVLSSIVVGYAALVFMDGLSTGMIHQMLENRIGMHTAHIQVHRKGFLDNRVLENRILRADSVAAALEATRGLEHYSGRVIAFGMVSSASGSAGVTVVGVDPSMEREVTLIEEMVNSGGYLAGEAREILVSGRLARKLDVEIGGKVVGMASGIGGEIGSELFRVSGIFDTYDSNFDETHVFVNIEDARRVLSLGSSVMEFAAVCSDADDVDGIGSEIASRLGEAYAVSTYRELLPLLVMQVDVYRQMMLIVYLIISLAIVLGIVNTMLMAVYERIPEFGVLFAVGMKRRKVFGMVVFEALLLGVAGTAAGMVAGSALTASLMNTGIDLSTFEESLTAFGTGAVIRPRLTLSGILSAAAAVPLVSVLGALYPAWRAVRLRPVEAIRYI